MTLSSPGGSVLREKFLPNEIILIVQYLELALVDLLPYYLTPKGLDSSNGRVSHRACVSVHDGSISHSSAEICIQKLMLLCNIKSFCLQLCPLYDFRGVAGLIAIIAVISILVGCYCYKRQCGNKLRRGAVVPASLATSVNSSEKNITPDPHHVHVPPENKAPMTAAPAYTAYSAPSGSAAPPPPYPAFPANGSPAGYPPVRTFTT